MTSQTTPVTGIIQTATPSLGRIPVSPSDIQERAQRSAANILSCLDSPNGNKWYDTAKEQGRVSQEPEHLDLGEGKESKDLDGLLAKGPARLEDLPEELILRIFSDLDSPEDVASAGATCKKMHRISTDDFLWNALFRSHFPHENPSAPASTDISALELYQQRESQRKIEVGPFKELIINAHRGDVPCLRVYQDMFFTASRDSTAKIWDRVTGECIQTLVFEGHEKSIICIAVDPYFIFTGSLDKTAKIWDIATGECIQTFEGHEKSIVCIAVDPDFIFTGSPDRTVKIWDRVTGKCIQTLKGHRSRIESIAVDPHFIVTGSYDRTVKIWDKATGECIQTLEGHEDGITSIAVDPHFIFTGSEDKTVKIWDRATGECIQTLEGHAAWVASIAVDPNLIFTSSWDKTVKIWSKKTGDCIRTLNPTHKISSLERDGTRLYGGASDGTLRIWEFDLKDGPSHSLKIINENLKILKNMDKDTEEKEDVEDKQARQKLLDQLHPDFRRRLERYARRSGASSPLSKEVISHVMAEIYIEKLLHFLHAQNQKRITKVLHRLHSIDREYTDKLYSLLAKESDQSQEWAEIAFHGIEGYNASMESKIQAVVAFKKLLRDVL